MKKYLGIVLVAAAVLAVLYVGVFQRRALERTSGSAVAKAQVTFVELGSVNCIPCKAMQPVMRQLEKRYGNQIQVVFHDVWQDDTPAKTYNIRVIPTQVFLDQNGHEFHRHEGFYPLEDIEKLLRNRGLKPIYND
jgi:thioredoxin 1